MGVAADSPATERFPIVALGASAGGLSACQEFFAGIPMDLKLGVAFVVIQHPDSDADQASPAIIRGQTWMPVYPVTDGTRMRPDRVYVAPPRRYVILDGECLRVLDRAEAESPRSPIDAFFRSLANGQREAAIGILLAGTGSDGTAGIRAIKAAGGLAMTQHPATRQVGKQRCALETGLVDCVAAPSEMSRRLAALISSKAAVPRVNLQQSDLPGRNELHCIFELLRSQTGHDFGQYEESTIVSRIHRRIAMHRLDSLETYRRFLQETPGECEHLFQDLLIGVTEFFRDPEAFEVLRSEALPRMLDARQPGATFRVWVCGCSTGEEAYSIAMLIHEAMQSFASPREVQIFATDIDSRAIERARTGLYPKSNIDQISSERLERYFTRDPGTDNYRIKKCIREMVLFSEQDVTRDPPFSKIDLISCRNLLIYFNAALQKRLISLFHFAVMPNGVLFLGPSETSGDEPALFSPIDSDWKLYLRQTNATGRPLSVFRNLPRPLASRYTRRKNRKSNATVVGSSSLRDIAERAMLDHLTGPALLANVNGDALHILERAEGSVEQTWGDAQFNVIDTARSDLKRGIATVLHRSVTSISEVARPYVRGQPDNGYISVVLTVKSVSTFGWLTTTSKPLLPVAFEVAARIDAQPTSQSIWKSPTPAIVRSRRVAELENELRETEESLRTTIEQLESSNEDLRTANEELETLNEELESANEELETSKEQLHSLNDEFAEVNSELQNKLLELSRVNNDMSNLLASTSVGTLFLDEHLRISRFSPPITDLVNLIPSDVGRPLAHIVSNLKDCDRIDRDAQSVLETLVPKEATVQARSGAWYLMQVRPYRTIDNVVDGVVVTFVHLSEPKQAEALLYGVEVAERLRVDAAHRVALCIAEGVAATVTSPLLVLSASQRVLLVNSAYCRQFSLSLEQVEGRFIHECGGELWAQPRVRQFLDEVACGDPDASAKPASIFASIAQHSYLVHAKRWGIMGGRDEILILTIATNGDLTVT